MSKRKDWIMEALQEAILFMEAPSDSPRHWPVSRGNLMKLLNEALEQRKLETRCRGNLTKLLTEALRRKKERNEITDRGSARKRNEQRSR